jgi:hypothetical protein
VCTTRMVKRISADQFCSSLEEGHRDAMKQLVVEVVLPSLFDVALCYEEHPTWPTSDLTTIIEWYCIIPMHAQMIRQEDTTNGSSDIEATQKPAARCSPMVDPSFSATPSNSLHESGKGTPSSNEDEDDASLDCSPPTKRHCGTTIQEPAQPSGTVHTPTRSRPLLHHYGKSRSGRQDMFGAPDQALQSPPVTYAVFNPGVASWPYNASVVSIESAFRTEKVENLHYKVLPTPSSSVHSYSTDLPSE